MCAASVSFLKLVISKPCSGPQHRLLCSMFSLVGPTAHELVSEWGGAALLELQENAHATMEFDGAPVVVFKSSGLGVCVPGWTFIMSEASAADFWRKAALKVRMHVCDANTRGVAAGIEYANNSPAMPIASTLADVVPVALSMHVLSLQVYAAAQRARK